MTKIEAYRKDVSDKAKEINALKSQLAAERGKVREAEAEQKATEAGYDMIAKENKQLREQLAAERSAKEGTSMPVKE